MSTAYAIAPPLFEPEGGGPTLDDVLVGAWEGLTAHRTVDCPVCGGEMAPAPAAGRCGSCGSELS
jgi:hypothetical protein